MFRRILLSMLATATLAGCATAYTYRGGNGDYYYGQPQTEYRYHDPYGFYGGFGYGGYAPGVHYDRYGRVIYGSYYGYFGYPPGYGSPWWYRPRAPHDGHDHGGDGHDGDGHGGEDGDGSDRRPPWHNPDGLSAPGGQAMEDRDDTRPRARRMQAGSTPSMLPAQQREQREQRTTAPPPPRMRSDDGGGSRMGRAIRNAKASPVPEE